MKFNLFILPTIPATFEERARLRPIGRNNDKYQQMLQEVRDVAQMADDLGFDAMSTTEHHFHSEGYEASVAPLLLYTDLAARTKFPGETGPVPNTYERMVEAKYELVGTSDDIKRELDALRQNSHIEWFGWYLDQGLMSWDEAKRQLELFATKIMPEFKD